MKKLFFLCLIMLWISTDVNAQKFTSSPAQFDIESTSIWRDSLFWVVDINLGSLGKNDFAAKGSFQVKAENKPSFIRKGVKGKGVLTNKGDYGQLKITEAGGKKLRRPFTVNIKYKGNPPKLE